MAQQNQPQNVDPLLLLPPNPPAADEAFAPPHFPDIKTYTITTLDRPYARPNVRRDEIYFFAPKTIRIAVYFEKTNKFFVARVSNMKVRHWHVILSPENPQEPKPPLRLEWYDDGEVMGKRDLVEENDLWDELGLGLGGEGIEGGVCQTVFVVDA